MSQILERFRSPITFWSPALLMFSFMGGTSICLTVLIDTFDFIEAITWGIKGAFIVAALFAPYLFIVHLQYGVNVYSNGLSSNNPHRDFKKGFLEWNFMHQIQEKKHFGLRYYLISSTDQMREIWLPRSIKDMDALLCHIKKNLPHSSIVRQTIENDCRNNT